MCLPICSKQPKGLKHNFSTTLSLSLSFSAKLIKNNKLNLVELKASHYPFIEQLYRNRKAPVVPFDLKIFFAGCTHCLVSSIKT